eukprot:scaffold191331_cov30-Tisochrysis_lutea.AAC.6
MRTELGRVEAKAVSNLLRCDAINWLAEAPDWRVDLLSHVPCVVHLRWSWFGWIRCERRAHQLEPQDKGTCDEGRASRNYALLTCRKPSALRTVLG